MNNILLVVVKIPEVSRQPRGSDIHINFFVFCSYGIYWPPKQIPACQEELRFVAFNDCSCYKTDILFQLQDR